MQTIASRNYRKQVDECALELIGQGGFTAADFSKKCGFRLTRHLRAHLRRMVRDGVLQATESYTDGGRLATFYHRPVDVVQEILPLQPF